MVRRPASAELVDSAEPALTDQRERLKYGLSLTMGEALTTLLEYLVFLTMEGSIYRAAFPSTTDLNLLQHLARIIYRSLSTLLFIYWISFRHSSTFGLDVGVIPERLGMFQMRLSPLFFKFVAFQFVSNAVVVFIHYVNDSSLITVGNLIESLRNPSTMFDMLVIASIREEFLFRGIMSLGVARRYGRIQSEAIAVIPSLLFASVHLLNFQSSRYTPSYVCMQITLSLLIGLVYAIRLRVTGCLWETILLHATNNFLASFVRTQDKLDLTAPIIMIPLMHTFIVYGLILRNGWPAASSDDETAIKQE